MQKLHLALITASGDPFFVYEIEPSQTVKQAIMGLIAETNDLLDEEHWISYEDYAGGASAYGIVNEELQIMPLEVAIAREDANAYSMHAAWFNALASISPDKGQIVTW